LTESGQWIFLIYLKEKCIGIKYFKKDRIMPHIFISYSNEQSDIAKNLKTKLMEYNINAWLYAIDRTLATDCWEEIKENIESSRLLAFIVSSDTLSSKGQIRELRMSLRKLVEFDLRNRILPIAYGNVSFKDFPKEIMHINGLQLDSFTIKETAYKIAHDFFPEIFENYKKLKWFYPRPGQWLKIRNISIYMGEQANIGDIVYFRRISPLGLFECFYPKINCLFCFAPNDLQPADELNQENTLEKEYVPERYRIITMISIEQAGIRTLEKNGLIDSPLTRMK